MTNLQYCVEILGIIGDVSVAEDAIYQLGFDVYRKLGGQEDKPTIDTIYKELKQAISIWDNTDNLTITENGSYSLLGKTIDVSVGSPTPIDPTNDYLTFNALGNDVSISLVELDRGSYVQYLPQITLEYSKNGGSWVNYNVNDIITLQMGETLKFRGNNEKWGYGINTTAYATYKFDTSGGQYSITGNLLSLTSGDNFASGTFPAWDAGNQTTSRTGFYGLFSGCSNLVSFLLPNIQATKFCYEYMFENCTGLTSVSGTLNTVDDFCYRGMFLGCTSLTSVSSLSATILANACYLYMFKDCTSLTTAPELPATTLANHCYRLMFVGCTSLINAPELPATTLADYCYYNMFLGCTSLTIAPTLPATTLAISCYDGMFSGCSSLTSAPELPATTLTNSCYYSMFLGCTSLTIAPELPAITLVDGCYKMMFKNCSNLSYVKCLAVNNVSARWTTEYMMPLNTTGTFVKAANAVWAIGDAEHFGIPSGWTVINAELI